MLSRSTSAQLAAMTAVILASSHTGTLLDPDLTLAGLLRTVLSALLASAVLTATMSAAVWNGWQAVMGVFVVYWGVSHFNTLNEALFFGLDLGTESIGGLALRATLSAVVIAAATPIVTGRWSGPAMEPVEREEWSVAVWIGRVALSAVAYFVFYFAAGILVFPFVQEFYAGRPLPDLGQVFIMQIVRGSIYAGIAVVFLRMIGITRKGAALLLGAVLSVFGGLAPLLPPNPIMPEPIRNAHLIEVGVSNFLYGLVLTRIIDARRRPQ